MKVSSKTALLAVAIVMLSVLPTMGFGSTEWSNLAVREAPPGFVDITETTEGRQHAKAIVDEVKGREDFDGGAIHPDDLQVFQRSNAGRDGTKLVVTASRAQRIERISEATLDDGTMRLDIDVEVTSDLAEELHARQTAREEGAPPASAYAHHIKTGTGNWDYSCSLLNATVWGLDHDVNQYKPLVRKLVCARVVVSPSTVNTPWGPQYDMGVHARTEGYGYRFRDQAGDPYNCGMWFMCDDWGRLDWQQIRIFRHLDYPAYWSGANPTRAPNVSSCLVTAPSSTSL